MPSLFRLLATIAIIGGLIYGGLVALSQLGPSTREITVTIPPDRYLKN